MAPKTDPSLRELMKSRNKTPSPKDKNKSKPPANPPPPPPQIPANLGLKPNPDLRKKRPMDTVEEGELGPSKEISRPEKHRTIGAEGPVPWTTEKKPWWPKYIGLHVLGHLCWRLTVYPSRLMPRLGIIVGGMLAWWLRFWNNLFSSLRIWRLTGALTIRNSSFPYKGTWLWSATLLIFSSFIFTCIL